MKGNSYFGNIGRALVSLGTGLKTTLREYFTPKVTEQYPENRRTLVLPERSRGRLVMPHTAEDEHRCVACGLCQAACPNGSIRVISEQVEGEDGKKRRRLLRYEYNLGSCMFCQLCTNACPHDAIAFDREFENAVFDRSKLVQQLNRPGSRLAEKRPASEASQS